MAKRGFTMNAPHIFRWDLDKTYLKTEFDTLKDLIKTALQKPADKANVPGSAELLRALRTDAGGNAEIYFLSGSPRQMEGILTKKLLLDGVDFEGFVLKDNLRNLLRFRFRALKEQIGYKLPALLKSRAKATLDSQETLFGDDAERDAFVYSLYADLLAERVSPKTLDDVLNIAGVYSDCRDAVYLGLDNLQPTVAVERIIIHLDRRSPPIRFDAYGSRVVPVYNYFQAALVLFADGRIKTKTVNRIGAALINSYQFTLPVLVRSFQDVLRRGAIKKIDAQKLIEQSLDVGIESGLVDPFYDALKDTQVRPNETGQTFVPDYAMLLRRELDRHRIEKSRQRWRFLG